MAETSLQGSEIKELIEQRRWGDLRMVLSQHPAPDLADLLSNLEMNERALLFHVLPREVAAEAFSYLGTKEKDALIRDLTHEETRRLLEDLSPDDRTEFFADLPGQAIQRLMNLLSPGDRKETLQLLGYPEESVGRLMTPDYVAVKKHWTIEQALEHIRDKGSDSETVNIIYVVDDSWKLLDAIDLRKLILAPLGHTVVQVMDDSFVGISAYEDREEAVEWIQRYDLVALPVVDPDGVLLGIVTVDDVMDVAQKEATEDFHKITAISPLKASYSESSVWSLYRKRVGWLVILILVNLLSSGVIAAYEETLATYIALAFFIPLLIGSGGNAGTQSATLVVRAIATGDVKLSQWARIFGREISVGLLLGGTMGLAGGLLGLFRGGYQIGVVVLLAMISIVLVANLFGTLLPFLLTRFRLDPAVASSPLIATLADGAGLLIYFSLATKILGGMR